MHYTVKQLANLAGITPRTLHYYDEIDLLRPSMVADNGYRYYDESAVLRLQHILFYRELALSLADIRSILDASDFDTEQALLTHRAAQRERLARTLALIETIDSTIAYLRGEKVMKVEELFGGFETEQEKEWSMQAMDKYGHDNAYVRESARRWRTYTAADKARIKSEGSAIYIALVGLIDQNSGSPEVQAQIAAWHDHLRYYYEPTPELMVGLGEMYAASPDFAATFTAMHPDLPTFLRDAISIYVDRLTA